MPNKEPKRIKADSDPTLARIVRIIISAVSPKSIYLFGSRADGTSDVESDYDLLLIYDGPLPKIEVEQKVVRSFTRHDFSMDLFIMSSAEFNQRKFLPMSLAREVFETGCLVDA